MPSKKPKNGLPQKPVKKGLLKRVGNHIRRIFRPTFPEPPSHEKVLEAVNTYLKHPEAMKAAMHPLEPSRHAFRLPIGRKFGRKQFVAVKVATERDHPQEQLRATIIINREMKGRNPKHFFFSPYSVYFAAEEFLVSEVVRGVSMQQLFDHLNGFKETRQAGHFLKTHPKITEEKLHAAWRELSRTLASIAKKGKFRYDDKSRNIMVRGCWEGLPVLTPIDQGSRIAETSVP